MRSRLRKIANTKYTNIVTNKQVMEDFKKEIGNDNILFYGKDESINDNLLIDGYTGFYFMPSSKNKDLYKTVVYAMEIHAFYRKTDEEIFKIAYSDLAKKPESDYQRRRKYNETKRLLNKLPPKVTLVYLAAYNNTGTKEKVNFEETSVTHEVFKNTEPGEKLPINPEMTSGFNHFTYNGIDMLFLKNINSIDAVNTILNAPGNIVDKA